MKSWKKKKTTDLIDWVGNALCCKISGLHSFSHVGQTDELHVHTNFWCSARRAFSKSTRSATNWSVSLMPVIRVSNAHAYVLKIIISFFFTYSMQLILFCSSSDSFISKQTIDIPTICSLSFSIWTLNNEIQWNLNRENVSHFIHLCSIQKSDEVYKRHVSMPMRLRANDPIVIRFFFATHLKLRSNLPTTSSHLVIDFFFYSFIYFIFFKRRFPMMWRERSANTKSI